jgi:hypothetical protein
MAIALHCPNCGEQLVPAYSTQDVAAAILRRDWAAVRGYVESAPWVSPSCARAWWPAELTSDSRAAWDPHHRESKFADIVQLLSLVDRDAVLARIRQMGANI